MLTDKIFFYFRCPILLLGWGNNCGACIYKKNYKKKMKAAGGAAGACLRFKLTQKAKKKTKNYEVFCFLAA
jgi:hypothetical protein